MDAPYGRASSGQATVEVERLKLRLPVLEKPGKGKATVRRPAKKFLPEGYALARGQKR